MFSPHLAINATPGRFAAALVDLVPVEPPTWRGAAATAHSDYLTWSEAASDQPGDVNLGEIMIWLRENLPADAITLQWRGQLCRMDPPLFPLPRFRQSHSADVGVNGLRHAIRGWRCKDFILIAASSRSTATAIS